MLRNDYCTLNEHVRRRHRRVNSQFIRQVMLEEDQLASLRAKEILDATEHPFVKEQKITHEICSELAKMEREKFLGEKQRIKLYQNETEIRDMVAYIERTHIYSSLVEQKAIKEKIQKRELEARLEESRRCNEKLRKNKEIALKEERESNRKKTALRQDLLKQMLEREKQREQEKELIAKERQNNKRLVEKIQQDMEKEQKYVADLKQLLTKEKNEYLASVEIYKKQQKLDAQEDYQRDLELFRQRDEEKRLRAEQRKRILEERAAISEHIGQQVLNLQIEKQKHNDLLLDLLIGERLAHDNERYQNQLDTQKRTSRSLRAAFQETFAMHQQEAQLRRQEELNLAKEHQKIFEESERKEKAIRDQKIPINRQHRQYLLDSIQYKKLEREAFARENKMIYEKCSGLEKKRQEEIEAEKLRLLRAEPLENLKYLPYRAISSEHRSILGLTCK